MVEKTSSFFNVLSQKNKRKKIFQNLTQAKASLSCADGEERMAGCGKKITCRQFSKFEISDL